VSRRHPAPEEAEGERDGGDPRDQQRGRERLREPEQDGDEDEQRRDAANEEAACARLGPFFLVLERPSRRGRAGPEPDGGGQRKQRAPHPPSLLPGVAEDHEVANVPLDDLPAGIHEHEPSQAVDRPGEQEREDDGEEAVVPGAEQVLASPITGAEAAERWPLGLWNRDRLERVDAGRSHLALISRRRLIRFVTRAMKSENPR
jgi:hypothetical protein